MHPFEEVRIEDISHDYDRLHPWRYAVHVEEGGVDITWYFRTKRRAEMFARVLRENDKRILVLAPTEMP